MKMRRTIFPYTTDETKKLRRQKPEGIMQYSVERLKQKYPKEIRRIYAPTLDVLKYWENTFRLDWGEPECFACKHMQFNPDSSEYLINKLKEYDKKDKPVPEHIWARAWSFERCHIISACFGGPGEAWNIVYLCSSCHDEMDRIFAGYPNEYYIIIDWLQKRRQNLLEYITQNAKSYAEAKGCPFTLENVHEVMSLIDSKEARSTWKNRHMQRESSKSKHGYSPANNILARWYYCIDEYLKSNKPGPESV